MATYTDENSAMAPARKFEAVTPGTDFANGVCRSLYVGSTGNVVVAGVTFTDVPAGSILPIATPVVTASGTTASNMVAMF
jgi:hypothetical protein